MVRTNLQERISPKSRKNAQPPPSKEQIQNQNAVLLEVLKTVETQLQKRGLLKIPANGAFHPVWFLAETERNIFLWRTGCSIIEHDEFEFWIDVRSLVRRRLTALDRFDTENPFTNPLWGSSVSSTEQVVQERNYLSSFMDILESIESHATALCLVAQSVMKELCPEAGLRESVLLPSPLKGKKTPDSSSSNER